MSSHRDLWVPLLSLLASLAVAVTPAGSARAADVQWPDTEMGEHARAWFEMLRADDAGARAFLTGHMAASALTQVPLEERLERRRSMLANTGGLTPLEVVNVDATSISVRCKAGNGDDVMAVFQGEDAAPHKLLGVRLEAGPPGEAPTGPAGPPLTDREAAMCAARNARAPASSAFSISNHARACSLSSVSGHWTSAARAVPAGVTAAANDASSESNGTQSLRCHDMQAPCLNR